MDEKKQKSGKATKIFRIIMLFIIVGCVIYLAQYGATSAVKLNKTTADKTAYFKIETNSFAASNTESILESNASPQGTAASDRINISVDFAALHERSRNVSAWIYIPALEKVSYPVVYSGDDSYYLTHSWDSQSDSYGAIFIEAQNKNDLCDPYTIIYGHDMIDGSMFASIKKFKDQDFYQTNSNKIYIITEKNTQVYEIFSLETVDPKDSGVYTVGFVKNDEYKSFLKNMKSRSMYYTGVDVAGDENVITLSTCSGSTQRFVLHAKLCDTY